VRLYLAFLIGCFVVGAVAPKHSVLRRPVTLIAAAGGVGILFLNYQMIR
jgi:hypothetical protein